MEYKRRMLPFRISHPTVSGLWYSFLWMMIGALILSLFLHLSQMQEDNLSVYTYLTHALSIGFGGIAAGKRSGRKGWYQGGLVGVLYGIIVLLISFLALDSQLILNDFLLLLPASLIGMVGGVMGVNLQK
ncbi:TIGR04086 family membrane protein [Paenibacillus sp. SN-8-1]|uniref:TIGR04086 family membrane protein n=1 Tax=Paenibacillus sp. SN-8-1 TaxID=3435409 RepID=UPI003D9A7F04